jgi:hypothetical protein
MMNHALNFDAPLGLHGSQPASQPINLGQMYVALAPLTKDLRHLHVYRLARWLGRRGLNLKQIYLIVTIKYIWSETKAQCLPTN